MLPVLIRDRFTDGVGVCDPESGCCYFSAFFCRFPRYYAPTERGVGLAG